jgi:hypothetical protein
VISVPESRDAYHLSVACPGEEVDVLETGDELSATLVKNAAKRIGRAYDGESGLNTITVEI